MLTIVFDGICFGDGPPTGVGRAFLSGLAAYAANTPHTCVLLVPAGATVDGLPTVRQVTAPRGALLRQLALPRLLRSLRADVLHSSVAAVPLFARCPTIATAHDLPWLHAELGEPTTTFRRFAAVRSLRTASAVLAPSRLTATDVVAATGRPHRDIWLVPHGTPSVPCADVAARTGPFLVLGDARPRKNLARVREAHALASHSDASLPALQCIGPGHDYVDEAQKGALLARCRAVVHCSLFEGFGLPVLEGLAHGAPVVCSDLRPHREIAGEHAQFVDPRSPAAIAEQLLAVHQDVALRATLAEGGWHRAQHFPPQRVADAWHRVHQQVAR